MAHPLLPTRISRLLASALLPAALLTATLAGSTHAAEPVLTLYSAQHQQMVNTVLAEFTKQTGIKVRARFGEAPEIASQIAKEGASSPADVYFTENSPKLMLLGEKGLLAPVAPATLAMVPAQYSSPKGDWVGVFARENVLAYNPAKIQQAQLPASLLDLAKPEWKGKIAFAPTDADFLPLVAAVAATKGDAGAVAWLKGLRANGQVFDDDEGVVAAVERGAAATGIINSYYLERQRAEVGADKIHSAVHHFADGDIGALVNVSGAAVLKSSRNPAAAQRLVAFLVSKPVQQMVASGDIDFEYPLVPGIAANPVLKPFDQLQPPKLTLQQLGDDRGAARLLRQAGLL